MKFHASGLAPAPSPSLTTSLQPPSSIFGPIETSFPVTKFITLGIFIAGAVGFIIIGIFLIVHFYKRRFDPSPRRSEADLSQVAVQDRKIPAIYEGFIVSNPCGGEQVAYKMEEEGQGTELKEIIVKSTNDSCCTTTACSENHSSHHSDGSCCGNANNTAN